MTRVLFWKEVREQATILLALMTLGSALLLAVAVLLEPTDSAQYGRMRAFSNSGGMALIMLLMAAGVVTGGSLFAGEVEAGTFGFLDRLPGSRWRIWWRKVLAGAGMVGVAASVLIAVALAAGLVQTQALTLWLLFGFLIAFSAYGWGVLGSVISRSSLAACGIGLGFGFGVALMLFSLGGIGLSIAREQSAIIRESSVQGRSLQYAFLATFWSLLAIPLPISWWLFTGPDRSRRAIFASISLPGLRGISIPTRLPWGSGTRRLLWLTIRQMRTPALILGVIELVLGCTMLIPDVQPILLWPFLTFAGGVFAAIVGVSDEQQENSIRFWGERRLPAGRLWLAKVLSGLGLSLLLCVLVALPLVFQIIVRGEAKGPFVPSMFRTGLIAERGFPVVSFLFLWAVYGFAFTHLAAILFSKAVVAAAVGGMVGATFAAFWFPSVLGGGLHLWQVFLPPLMALVVARLVVWAWATNRLGNVGPLVRLTSGLVATVAVGALALGYRVLEVPLAPNADDHVEFARQLPTFDEKQSGRDLRRAAGMYTEMPSTLRLEKIDSPLAKRGAYTSNPQAQQPFLNQSQEVFRTGYPANRPDYDDWLRRMFAVKWDEAYYAAAAKPVGVLEDVNELTLFARFRSINAVQESLPLLLVRALERQAKGNPADFVEALAVALSALRTTANNSPPIIVGVSRALESETHLATDRWLDRLDGRPELLAKALQVVRDHEANDPYDPKSARLADQVLMANAFLAPSQWAPGYFDDMRPGGGDRLSRGQSSPEAEVEANLLGFAWAVPWERERHHRVVGLGNTPGPVPERGQYLRGTPGIDSVLWDDTRRLLQLTERQHAVVAARRASILKLAIRLYEHDQGKPPATLDQLVPKYLPAVPQDPYSNAPFSYRVSAGETVIAATGYEDEVPFPTHLPGFTPTEVSREQMTAVAGTFGGGTCWPLVTGWYLEQSDTPGGSMGLFDIERFRKTPGQVVEPGQPLVWSVGPDRANDYGRIAWDLRATHTTGRAGDLAYPVPRRPTQRP